MPGMTARPQCQYPPLDREPCGAEAAPPEGGDGLIRYMPQLQWAQHAL